MIKGIHASHSTLLKEVKHLLQEREIIYEGLIYSYDIKNVLGGLKKMNYKQGEVKIEKTFTGYVVLIKLPLEIGYTKKIEVLNKFMENLCGWQLSAILHSNGKVFKKNDDLLDSPDEFVWLQYEPKFDVEVNFSEIPDTLYHICQEKILDKIKKIGLTPKTKSKFFSYSDRIYVCNNIDDLLSLSKVFITSKDKINSDNENSNSFIILQIKIKSLLLPVRLFKDPNFENGYYTLENIQPHVIKPIIKIELNNKGEIIKKENL